MTALLRFLLVFLLATAVTSPAGARSDAGEDARWKERFLSEAPARWSEYRKRGERLQGSCTFVSVDRAAGGRRSPRSRYELRQAGPGALWMVQSLSGRGGTGRLEAVNSRYAFRLERPTAESPWIIAGLDA